MKSWLEEIDIEMYSTYHEGESIAVERFIRILKNEIDKYMTSVSKTIYIEKLEDVIAPNQSEEVLVIEKVKKYCAMEICH